MQRQWVPTIQTCSDSEYSSDDDVYTRPVLDLMRCEPTNDGDPPIEPEAVIPHSSQHSEPEPTQITRTGLNNQDPSKRGTESPSSTTYLIGGQC